MNRRLGIVLIGLSLASLAAHASETSRPEDNGSDEPDTTLDSEAGGIIPQGGLTVSTQPITPIEPLQEGDPYEKAIGELTMAQGLLEKGRMEAASDVALQAYDDLVSIYAPPTKNKKRRQLQADRHQAATVYIASSLAYIDEFVKRAGGGPHAMEEGRARLGDLRDVSMNYSELGKKVTEAVQRYTVESSTTTQ